MKALGTEGRGLDPKKQMLNNERNLTNPSPWHPCFQSGLLTTYKLGPYPKSDFDVTVWFYIAHQLLYPSAYLSLAHSVTFGCWSMR